MFSIRRRAGVRVCLCLRPRVILRQLPCSGRCCSSRAGRAQRWPERSWPGARGGCGVGAGGIWGGAGVERGVLQQASREGSTVAGAIVAGVAGWNATADDRTVATASGGGTTPTHRPPYGSIGVVIGATVDLSAAGIDAATDPPHPTLPVLAPGFGHQGAVVSDARAIYGSLVDGVIVSESRSILAAGPDGIADAVARHADQAAML